MIGGDAVDRMLRLTEVAPFGVLKETELLLVAQNMQPRRYLAGQTIIAEGQIAEVMIVTLTGSAFARSDASQAPEPKIIGASSILFGVPFNREVLAGPEGMTALCLAKPHLFTLARECPDFIVGLAQQSDQKSDGAGR